MDYTRRCSRHLQLNRPHGYSIPFQTFLELLHPDIIGTACQRIHIAGQMFLILSTRLDLVPDSLSLGILLVERDLAVVVDGVTQVHRQLRNRHDAVKADFLQAWVHG